MTVDTADLASSLLPGQPVPYWLPAGTGQGYLLGGQVNRFLATCAETRGLMAVANSVGPAGATVPPHYHNEQHDVLYCTRGRIQVTAGDQTRVLGGGDVASIPPHTPHTFTLLGHYTEIISTVVPCRWPRFFEIMGAPHGPGAYPPVDSSGPPSPAKLAQVAAEDIMVGVPDFVPAEPVFDAGDDAVPASVQPYFLRGGEGPRHLLFGQVCFQILPGSQTRERTAMTITEGPMSASTPEHVHAETHEAIFCLAGRMRVWTDGEQHDLAPGDFVSVPSGVPHRHQLGAYFNRFATFVAPAGIERLHEVAGTVAEQAIFPEQPEPVDSGRLAVAAQELDITFLDAAG